MTPGAYYEAGAGSVEGCARVDDPDGLVQLVQDGWMGEMDCPDSATSIADCDCYQDMTTIVCDPARYEGALGCCMPLQRPDTRGFPRRATVRL